MIHYHWGAEWYIFSADLEATKFLPYLLNSYYYSFIYLGSFNFISEIV